MVNYPCRSGNQPNLREAVLLEHPQYLAVPESFRRGSEADFARHAVHEMVCRKRLDETRLAIATRAKDNALCVIGRAPGDHDINRSLLAEILTGRRSRLDSRGHLGEFLLPLRFGKRPNLFLEQFLSCRNALHNLAIKQATHGADGRHLGMILEPYRLVAVGTAIARCPP